MPTIRRDGVQLYYEVHGEGYPLVFIHGGGGNTMAFYQQVPYFRRNYKVITVDLRYRPFRTSSSNVSKPISPDPSVGASVSGCIWSDQRGRHLGWNKTWVR